jgi:hypothetical protein
VSLASLTLRQRAVLNRDRTRDDVLNLMADGEELEGLPAEVEGRRPTRAAKRASAPG